MKNCRKCLENKELIEFSKNSSKEDGLNSICKECDRIKSKKYRDENPDKVSKSRKNTYIKNKEKYLLQQKKYYENNKDKIIVKNKKYYSNNKEAYKNRKKIYYDKNKESLNKLSSEYGRLNRKKITERDKLRRNTEPLYRTIRYCRNRINKFLKSKNYKKNYKSFDMIGCSPEELKKHIESKFTYGMSWELVGKEIHIDHIIPLSSANTIEQVESLCHYSNLQPLWAKDNLKKKNKII